MSEIQDIDYSSGAKPLILPPLRDRSLTAIRAAREWFDNGLDAGATSIEIILGDDGLLIRDNGNGCEDVTSLLMFGKSKPHGDGRRAGMYGLGGTMSNVKFSDATITDVTTVHQGKLHSARADWERQLKEDRLFVIPMPSQKPKPGERGTTIFNHGCKAFGSKHADIVDQLGFDYYDVLKAGVAISLDIKGKKFPIKPYSPPRFTDRCEFSFEYHGSTVHGFCGVVSPEVIHKHEGWTFHWGPHRVLTTNVAPADGRYCGRLEGHVWLPESCVNPNITKDDFADPQPEDLFAEIGRHCERIIAAASCASTEYELGELKAAVESELNDGLTLPIAAKGARPGSAGKVGAVIPTGNGSPHKHFNIWQPGTRGTARISVSIPQRYEVHFEPNMGDDVFRVQMNKGRNPVAHLTLNSSHDDFREAIETGHAPTIKLACKFILTAHLAIHKEEQQLMGIVGEMDFHDVYRRLTSRSSQREPALV